jgi:hypothetical protein
MEAQEIILNASGPDDPNLERAKDIADLINNGLWGEDADSNDDGVTLNCEIFDDTVPPELQPPPYDDLPQAPEHPPVDNPPIGPAPDPETCEGVRVNQYNVESPTSSPFYGIKFEYQSGTEIRDGNFDEFRFTLTAEQAAAMTSMQVEAKAGQEVYVGTVALEDCAFDSMAPCGGEQSHDENSQFAVYFMGAQDNEDGTLTLVFHLYNFTDHGLSHATFGLPDGVVPSSPPNTYQSRVCP